MQPLNLDQLDRAIVASRTLEDLESACELFCLLCQCDYYHLMVCDIASLHTPEVSLWTNYPASWRKAYAGMELQKKDPIIKYSQEANTPITWAELMATPNYAQNTEDSAFTEAKKYGLIDGLTVPVKSSSARFCVFNLASRRNLPQGDTLAQTLLLAHSFAYKLFDALLRIQSKSCSASTLTKRELECLFWACKGKTAWEISVILGITERTVTFHLTSAAKKLGATNRQHAVAKAVLYGHVKPDLNYTGFAL